MLKRRISGVLLAGILLLSGGITIMASEAAVPDISKNLKVVKYFEMAEGLATPEVSFKFTVEQSGQNPQSTPDLTVAEVTYGVTDEEEPIKGIRKIKKEAEVTIPEANQFPHAGEYLYTIKETNEHTQYSDITYSVEEYVVRVRVKNAAAGNKLEIASVTANKNAENDADKNKNKVSEISFTNTYAKDKRLTIEKKTTGDFGDKTKKFDFAITFTKKAEDDTAIYKGKIGDQPIDCTAGEKKTFQLSDGEKLVFDSIPVGTRYVVEEAGAQDGYTPSVTVTENGITHQKKTAAGENQGISSVPDNAPDSLVGEKDNMVVFENNYQEIAMTGVIMNNLPFVLLVAVSVAAIGILLLMKRKTSGK